ncbi:hypothetical protein HWV62_30673 [Athelia sp. TMB]|nr:hypothetical protein HWV62_30673 [Athelia sp. TMB]
MEMDRVPFEIWATISSHACTDSGSTGRNLSLVSRLIRDASAPVKLQSIAAHGTEQLVALHKLLLTTPAHLRRTRYLLLSEKPLGADSAPGIQWPEQDAEKRRDAERRRKACRGILVQVHEFVEILDIDMSNRLDDLAWTMSFPRLEELTSDGFPLIPQIPKESDVLFEPGFPLPDSIEITFQWPHLRRWHLTRFPYMWGGCSVFGTIPIVAPAITHLRFSSLHEASFCWDLEAALGLATQESGNTSLLPSTIQQVYVKLAPPPPNDGWYGTGAIAYKGLVDGLENLRNISSQVVSLGVAEPESCISTLADWEDRVAGGEGCWSLRGVARRL